MNIPADIAITPFQDIEVPGYLPGFRSQHWTAILTATMLCYALPVTVIIQKFTEIQPRLISARGYVGATFASGSVGATSIIWSCLKHGSDCSLE